MSGWQVTMALALPSPEIAWPIFVVLVLEWVVWPVTMLFLADAPRCPSCKSSFQWTEISTGGSRSRPLSVYARSACKPSEHRAGVSHFCGSSIFH